MVGRSKLPKLSGGVTLATFPPAMITMMKARIDEGATNSDIQREFGVSECVATAVRKTDRFSPQHLRALKKGLPDAFATIASESLMSINPDDFKACSVPQRLIIAGVAYDKYRLGAGESTQNIALKDVSQNAIEGMQAAENALKSLLAQVPTTATDTPKASTPEA